MSIATPPPRPADAPAVTLRCWLLRDRPLLSLAISLGVLLLAVLIYFASRNLLGTALSITALLVVMRRVWLPIRFRVDAQGIIRQVSGRSRRIPWSAIARYEICSRGVVLLPHGADYRLAAGQGLFVPWAGRKDEILALLAQYGPAL